MIFDKAFSQRDLVKNEVIVVVSEEYCIYALPLEQCLQVIYMDAHNRYKMIALLKAYTALHLILHNLTQVAAPKE
ncbi:uncharacterized protein PHALS_11003 [Plasmopara halstedii]|uniref:Uncharacterized protein n=1 Tax=Plasmopara halstedii TaxID=4781 RepID=A0A0P1AIS0_PLAHL|nr:uncharacterized protein PHALS_11003 [Plasmopara halstedii]CEG40823.1 hypothetical protein PHALS_11003 [Plasmopara halstedii]|eukprot:XP_024577192.1 hypothetical protein PHALS_11003 [Plasmopara halstedii]